MSNNIQLHKNDLPDDLNLGNIIAVDGEFMGLNVRRDPLCLIQVSSGNSDAHIIQFDREKTEDYYKFSVSISLEFIEKKSSTNIKTYNVNSIEYGEITGSFAIKDQDTLDLNLMHKSLESISSKLTGMN